MPAVAAPTRIQAVQVDGVALMKILRHCEDTAHVAETSQGFLVGIPRGDVLEVTNCFPRPSEKHESDFDTVLHYKTKMSGHFRSLNIDYINIGWYVISNTSLALSINALEDMVLYQDDYDYSIGLVFDPAKTAQGHLSLRAFHLSPEALTLLRDHRFQHDKMDDLTFQPTTLRDLGLRFDRLFTELPVTIHNSNLVALGVTELCREKGKPNNQFMKLASSESLGKQMSELMSCVDDMLIEVEKRFIPAHRPFVKNVQQRQQVIYRRESENKQRVMRGELPLPPPDDEQLGKPVLPAPLLNSIVLNNQITQHCNEINSYTDQAAKKLLATQAIIKQ